MSKVIKITQKDIQRIVENIVKEDREWKGSEDPEIMALGQMGAEEIPNDEPEDKEEPTKEEGKEINLAQNPYTGEYFVVQDDGNGPPIIQKINIDKK